MFIQNVYDIITTVQHIITLFSWHLFNREISLPFLHLFCWWSKSYYWWWETTVYQATYQKVEKRIPKYGSLQKISNLLCNRNLMVHQRGTRHEIIFKFYNFILNPSNALLFLSSWDGLHIVIFIQTSAHEAPTNKGYPPLPKVLRRRYYCLCCQFTRRDMPF